MKLKKIATFTWDIWRKHLIKQELACLTGTRGGRDDVEDDEWPDCPVTMKTNENIKKVRTLMRIHHHLGIRITEEFNMDKGTVKQILAWKKCVKTVPNNPPIFSEKTNTNARTHSILTRSHPVSLLSFPKIEKLTQGNPFSVKWRYPLENGRAT